MQFFDFIPFSILILTNQKIKIYVDVKKQATKKKI